MRRHEEVLAVLRAQTGDVEALDQLFRSIQEPLLLRIRTIVGQDELAADVVQDVFVLILRKIRWLREPKHFRSWAYRIAAREAFRHVKKERVRPSVASDSNVSEIPDPVDPRPIRSLLADQAADLVRELPAGSRAVLTLHYLDDLPMSEVAEILNVPLGTVKSRLAYGLSVLRRQFGEA